jgi:signal transduction histidine kinase
MARSQSDSVLPGPRQRTSDATFLKWINRLLKQEQSPSEAEEEVCLPEGMDALEIARLNNLVRARTAEIERARLAAEDANRAKALFLANMSHELRTPMHAILSYAQLGREATGDDQREYFNRITERGQQLLDMLSDLLDLSRLEAGSMSVEFSSNDIEGLARDALKRAAPLFRAKEVSVQITRPADCRACRALVDAVLIGKLFDNLLSNAARYSPSGGRVRMTFGHSTMSDGVREQPALEVAIIDEGVGIPESELELVFDKFVQSSKTRSNAGGTGLGLAICREIVALHGGKIWASNNQGPGATFHVLLPLLDVSLGREAP